MFILSDPNLGDFDLDNPANGVVLTQKDFGFPVVREVTADYPDDHGTVDRTAYFGERVVSCEGFCVKRKNITRISVLNRIKSYCLPYARPVLRFQYDGGSQVLQTRIRISEQSVPIENSTNFKFNLAWKVQPFFLGQDYSASAGFVAANAPGTNIWSAPFFPISFDSVFGDSIDVSNSGMVETWPLITLFGPISDPSISNVTTGKSIKLQGVTVGEQPDFVVFDMKNRTVRQQGGGSLASKIDYDTSNWWPLEPGQNKLTLDGSSPGTNARMVLQWNDLYL
jgi:hypothetical protein